MILKSKKRLLRFPHTRLMWYKLKAQKVLAENIEFGESLSSRKQKYVPEYEALVAEVAR